MRNGDLFLGPLRCAHCSAQGIAERVLEMQHSPDCPINKQVAALQQLAGEVEAAPVSVGFSCQLAEERITHVALLYEGKIWALPEPNHHRDIVAMIFRETAPGPLPVIPDSEGFLTNSGRYINRKEAFLLAKTNGQLRRKTFTSIRQFLFADDLWITAESRAS